MTSREELQSLNEELTALNSQLQETLERQRSTSNDLQNILDSSADQAAARPFVQEIPGAPKPAVM
jgi:hypothetical protein